MRAPAFIGLAALLAAAPAAAQDEGGLSIDPGFGLDAPEPASGPALPDPEGVLVVVVAEDPAAADRARAISVAATEALAKRLGRIAADLDAALDPAAEMRDAAAIAEAHALSLEGIAAFEGLELEAAEAALDEAILSLLPHVPQLAPDDRQRFATALFAYATTVLFEGRTDDADALYLALFALEPGFSPEAGRYPSNVIERFEDLRGALDPPTGRLRVESSPAGAEVWIDGAFRGRAPVEVGGLRAGGHLVSVREGGYLPAGEIGRVAPDTVTTEAVTLAATAGARRRAALVPALVDRPSEAAEVLADLHVEQAALVRLRTRLAGDTAGGLRVDLTSGRVVGEMGPMSVSASPDVAGAAIAEGLLGLAPAAPVAEAVTPGPPILEQWWFWTAIAVAAVAAGTSVAVVATRGDDGPPRNTAIFRF